jgi:hypothetical protein
MTKGRFDNNNFQKYLCDYTFNGSKWSIDIYAESWEQAEEKLIAIGKGVVIGDCVEEIPAHTRRLYLVE